MNLSRDSWEIPTVFKAQQATWSHPDIAAHRKHGTRMFYHSGLRERDQLILIPSETNTGHDDVTYSEYIQLKVDKRYRLLLCDVYRFHHCGVILYLSSTFYTNSAKPDSKCLHRINDILGKKSLDSPCPPPHPRRTPFIRVALGEQTISCGMFPPLSLCYPVGGSSEHGFYYSFIRVCFLWDDTW